VWRCGVHGGADVCDVVAVGLQRNQKAVTHAANFVSSVYDRFPILLTTAYRHHIGGDCVLSQLNGMWCAQRLRAANSSSAGSGSYVTQRFSAPLPGNCLGGTKAD